MSGRGDDTDDATAAYDRAIELSDNPIERRFLEEQRQALTQ